MTLSVHMITFFWENVPAARLAQSEFMVPESCLKCSYSQQLIRRSDTKQ